MTKNTSYARLASTILLALACTTGCSTEDESDRDAGPESETPQPPCDPGFEQGDDGNCYSIDECDEDQVLGADGECHDADDSNADAYTTPVDSLTYEGGTKILLKEYGIRFTIPRECWGFGEATQLFMEMQDLDGYVTVFGCEDLSRTDLDALLKGTFEVEEGETWQAQGDMEIGADFTSENYAITNSPGGWTQGTITAVYGEAGSYALIVGFSGADETNFSEVQDLVDAVAMTTSLIED